MPNRKVTRILTRPLQLGLWSDVRLAWLALAREPMVNGIVVVAVGLAIGGNASVFSAIYSQVLRPFGFEDEENLVFVAGTPRGAGGGRASMSPANFADLRDAQTALAEIGGFRYVGIVVGGDVRQATRAIGHEVSPGLLQTLRVEPLLGRLLDEGDQQRGARRTVLLSYTAWRNHFAQEASVLGQTIRIDGVPAEIVGVMPRGFDLFLGGGDFFLPLRFWGMTRNMRNRSFMDFFVVGRLRPGVSRQEAATEMNLIGSRLRDQYPSQNEYFHPELRSLREQFAGLGGENRALILIVQGGMVAVFLLAACCVGHLLLVRGYRREHEFAVRAAVGGSTADIVRQPVLEALILSIIGSGVGLAASFTGNRLLAASSYFSGLSVRLAPRFDGVTVGIVALMALVTSLLFCVGPAIRAARTQPAVTLRSRTPTATFGKRELRMTGAFLVSQTGLAALVLGVVGALTYSHWRNTAAGPGFDASGVIKAELGFPGATHGDPRSPAGKALRRQIVEDLLERMQALPASRAVAAASHLPGAELRPDIFVTHSGDSGESEVEATRLTASAAYPEVLGLSLLAGRWPEDGARTEAVIVEDMAHAFGCSSGCVGDTIRVRSSRYAPSFPAYFEDDYRVVGVVRNVQRTWGARTGPRPMAIYVSALEHIKMNLSLLLRTGAPPATALPLVRDVIRDVDRTAPLSRLEPLHEYVSRLSPRLELVNAWLLGFTPLAVLLSTLGTHGVALLLSETGRKDTCVRVALGASPRLEYWRELRRMAGLVALGLLTFGPLIGFALVTLRVNVSSWMPLYMAGAVYALVLHFALCLGGAALAARRVRDAEVPAVLAAL